MSFIESLCTSALLFYFSNINSVTHLAKNFSTIEWFQQTFENQILVAAKLKNLRNYQKLMFGRIPKKFKLCYFIKFVALVVGAQFFFSLDFSVLWQDLGKFQKHRWLHAPRTHCNVCLLINFQLVKGFKNL